MTTLPSEFLQRLPQLKKWIEETLARHVSDATPVNSLCFSRLPKFFPPTVLQRTKVVLVNECPCPPLTAMGLPAFSRFESNGFRGITFLDTYFVLKDLAGDEALHFHELVHVVQWQLLGFDQFLALYAEGILQYDDYRDNPLERIAYLHQQRFETEFSPYDVEEAVRRDLAEMRRG